MFSVWRSDRQGTNFLTDGESENIGDQTVEDSVEAISDWRRYRFYRRANARGGNGAKDRAENREFRQTVSDDNNYITGSMYPGGCHYFCNS